MYKKTLFIILLIMYNFDMIHLGIDFGTKNIGLAVSDENGMFAIDIPALKNNPKTIDEEILKVIEARNIEQIIMGLPGLQRENEITKKIKAFADHIKNLALKDVIFWDESYSSQNAESGLRGKRRKTSDSRAARMVLQEYLDFYNSMKK